MGGSKRHLSYNDLIFKTSYEAMQEKFSEKAVRFIEQFTITLVLHKKAWEFMKQNRPWKGLRQYGWMVWIMLGAALLLGWQFFREVWNLMTTLTSGGPAATAGFASFFENFSFEKFGWAIQGGRKYLVVIVLELFTFHFIRQTMEIRTGMKSDSSFQAFITAEKRMIVASLTAWIFETIVRGVANIALGIVGLEMLKMPAGLVIQFYFLGFLLIDNYLECFGKKVSESRLHTYRVAGVAVATGMVAYFLMFVPLVGVVVATMLGAVTATIAMERFAPVEIHDNSDPAESGQPAGR
jgi:hypothetical protein